MFVSIPEQLIENVQLSIREFEDRLKMIAQLILDQKISEYPIFIAHKEPQLIIGRPFIDAEQEESDWSFNVSHLEDFANKGLIEPDRIRPFKQAYKNPRQFLCLFIISGNKDGGFAFYPYHE